MIRRRLILAGLLATPLAARAQPAGPGAPIGAFYTALQAAMKAGPFAARAAILRPAVLAAFDLPAILQGSVGPRYLNFPEAGRAQLLAAFTDFTVGTWAANFDKYAGERFEVAAETRQVATDVVVQTRIVPTAGEATRLDYVMRNAGGAWKAVDILVNGSISRVAVQRSDFRAFLPGTDPAPLINMLTQKAASLAAGGT